MEKRGVTFSTLDEIIIRAVPSVGQYQYCRENMGIYRYTRSKIRSPMLFTLSLGVKYGNRAFGGYVVLSAGRRAYASRSPFARLPCPSVPEKQSSKLFNDIIIISADQIIYKGE